ncbi:MAG: ABC transporter permease subunit [Candidatus Dormibacteraeota bacterium]|nr:ABC transporter permease subunit [Candidatus Dormibacteraeota bacterium]
MIAVETWKATHRRLGWSLLALMALVPALLTTVIGLTRRALPERVGDAGAVITGTSGFTAPLIALTAMVLFLLPLAIAVFAGEAVAGEATWGSLRYLLLRPHSRSRVLAAKAAVAAVFSLAAVALVSASALVAGGLAFGWQPLTVVDLEHTTAFHVQVATFAPLAALGRLALATAVVAVTMASTFAFALLLSTLTRSPFAAAAGGVGLGIVSRALDNIPGLHALGPWLPMTDAGTTLWTGLFLGAPNVDPFARLALIQAAYTALFLVAAWLRFARTDVLS